jgi:hypothetical protein
MLYWSIGHWIQEACSARNAQNTEEIVSTLRTVQTIISAQNSELVDSGIADDVPALESRIVGRDPDVPAICRNTDHGTFVAGLLC